MLSAAGLVLIVSGILAADNNAWLMLALVVAGALVLGWFFVHVRAEERAGMEPLLSTSLFRNRTSNLGLVTQNLQWLILMGTSFTVAAYLQVVRGLQPDPDRRDLHRGHDRRAALLARRASASPSGGRSGR